MFKVFSWRIVVAGLIVVVSLVGLGTACGSDSNDTAATTSEGTSSATSTVPTPGISEPVIDDQFAVGADGRQLALLCYGEGSPMVFLEPGDDGTGSDDASLMGALAERTMTCTYDRTGFGGSDAPSKARRTLDDATGDVHALIEAADLPLPLVHVGISGGGLIALYHATRYPDDVAGVVLVDVPQDDPKEGAKLFPGARAWRNAEHLDIVDATRRVLRLPPLALEDIPLRVLTAADGGAAAEKNQMAWLELSSDSHQTTLPGGHNLVEENTEGVLAEIRAILDAIEG